MNDILAFAFVRFYISYEILFKNFAQIVVAINYILKKIIPLLRWEKNKNHEST